MTRFFVRSDIDESVAKLTEVIEKLGYSWKSYSSGVVRILFGSGSVDLAEKGL